jgi:16S rRNA (cytidine1402-2'-O)-methyltransferase
MINKPGVLYVVATPIGNLEDITLRALRVLKEVDYIACEDTRHTGILLKHFGIEKPLISYFQHSKLEKVEYIIELLEAGKNIALVTDAGTPAISDPGVGLIAQIQNPKSKFQNEIKVLPVPGASAMAAAASVSGLIEKDFYFCGFLPKKKGRQSQFKRLQAMGAPFVLYESANRLEKTLEDIRAYLGEGVKVFIAREMTKAFEEYWGGEISEVISSLKTHTLKGEVAVIVKPGSVKLVNG